MAIKGMFFNAVENGGVYDRTYNASDFVTYLHNIVGNGVFPNPSTQLQVMESSGMNIVVKTGEGWIEGHKLTNTQDYALSISASDPLYPRIDRVVAYIDYDGRKMGIRVNSGTAAASPVAPALVRNSQWFELSLATISVPRGATEITASEITDTRPDSNVCGWVAGLIQQLDTSTLFEQYTDAYNDYFLAIEAQIQDFVNTLTQELKINTYLAEYEWRETVESTSGPDITFEPVGYGYDVSDVLFVYINGLLAVQGTDYTTEIVNGKLVVSFTYTNPEALPQDLEIRALKTRMAIRIISAAGNGIIVDNNGNQLIGG